MALESLTKLLGEQTALQRRDFSTRQRDLPKDWQTQSALNKIILGLGESATQRNARIEDARK